MPASRAPALGEPSRGLSRRQPGDGSRWDGALAARRRGGGEASLAGCARQRERPAGILPATAAASCDSRPSRCGDFLLGRVSCENAGISRGRSSVPKAQCAVIATSGLTLRYHRHTAHTVHTDRGSRSDTPWADKGGCACFFHSFFAPSANAPHTTHTHSRHFFFFFPGAGVGSGMPPLSTKLTSWMEKLIRP